MTASTKPEVQTTTRPPVDVDITKWIVFGIIAVMALWVLGFARNQIVAPFDNLVTEQMCLRYGEQTERTLLDFERSNTFTLGAGTEGFCSFGPGPEGEPAIAPTIEETNPGSLYTWAKAIGLVLQLGVVSIFVRLITEPALATARFLVQRFSA